MLRLILISYLVALCLVIHGRLCYGQVRNVAPYFGASASLNIAGNPYSRGGWGVEAGLHLLPFYVGFEYGTYTNLFPLEVTGYPGKFPMDHSVSDEQFLGIHGGYDLKGKFYVGVVVLESYQLWNTWDTSSGGWVPFTKRYLNIGPDFRYSGIDDGHIYLAFALTIRRGLKAGIGYMF